MTARLTAAWRAGNSEGLAGWRFQFEFDQDAIDALKAAIPSECREWNPEEKWWWVSIEWEGRLIKLFPGLEAYRAQVPMF